MARIKYTPGGERRRFQQRGQGLRAGEQRIQEQAQTGIDAMKLAALRQEKLDNQFISGLTSKNNFEEGVLREKQELEGKARTRKYEAFQKFAETDVARMEGKAKDLEKKAEFWKDFAPKFAENLSQLAVGAWGFQDKLKGMARLNDMYDNGLLKNVTDGTGDASYGVGTNINLDRSKLRKEGNHNQSNLLGKIFNGNSHWLSLKMAKFAKENREVIRDDIIASFGEEFYTENNAVELQRFGMHQIMEKMGVSPRSAGGVQMLEQATNIGLLDRRNIIGKKNAGLTEGLIDRGQEDLGIALQSYFTDRNNPNEVRRVTNNLSLMINTQMENHLSGTFIEDGKLITPASGSRNKQEIYSTINQNIIKNNYKWMTRDQVEELLAMAVPKLEGEKKTEAYDKKFPTLSGTLLDEYDQLKRDQHNQADDAQKQKSIARMNVVNTEWNEKYPIGKTPTKEEQLKGVNSIMNDPELLPNQKKQILDSRGFNAENHDILPYVLNINNNMIDGNIKEVERLLRSKDIKENLPRILNEIKALQELQNYGPIANSTEPGLLGYKQIGSQRFKALQKVYEGTSIGKGLSSSGAYSQNEYYQFTLKTHLHAVKPKDKGGLGLSVADAVQHTLKVTEQEWDKGANTDSSKYGTGIFARKLDSASGQWIFQKHTDIDTEALALFNNKVEDDDFEGDGDWMTLNDDMVLDILAKDPKSILTDSYEDINQLLTHDRISNKKEMKTFGRQLINYKLHSSKKDGNIAPFDIDVPRGFHIISKYTGKPLADVVNAWIAAKLEGGNEKWAFLKDIKMPSGEDKLLELINADKISTRNLTAATYVNGSLAESGKVPRRKEVNAYLKQLEVGTNRAEALTNLFKDKTGINWTESDGVYRFSDSSGYLKNGGLDLPTGANPTDLLKSLGYDPEALVTNYDNRVKNMKLLNDTLYNVFTLGGNR